MARSAQLQSDRGNPRLKFLDRYAGIPLVAVLGLRRRLRGARPVPPAWNTVGILLTSGIGDTVLVTGVLADLRLARPTARIILFVTANNAAFARTLVGPDEVVELAVRRMWAAVHEIRARRCDVVVDFAAWRRFDAVLAALSGARVTIGLRTPGQHRHFGYDIVVDHGRQHEIENDRRLVAELGVTSESPPFISIPVGAVAPLVEPYVVLHLWPGGSNFEERSWSTDRWRELAVQLEERGFAVALTGGTEDAAATQAVVDEWGRRGLRAFNAAGRPWRESFGWLGYAVGVISVNTGVMHVAAALGTPTVALNGPTSATRWGPIGRHTRCVCSPMIPDGYLNLGFERDDRYRESMGAITVEVVLAAWDDLRAEVLAAGRP